jgi:hypothetical protein
VLALIRKDVLNQVKNRQEILKMQCLFEIHPVFAMKKFEI